MKDVYKVVQAKGNDIDFQIGGGCSELNRADLHPCCCYLNLPCCCYLNLPCLRLVNREVMVDLEYPLVLVSLRKFELWNYVV
jgi:hypothetical protein